MHPAKKLKKNYQIHLLPTLENYIDNKNFYLTFMSSKSNRTNASISVNFIYAFTSVPARMGHTIVDVRMTVSSCNKQEFVLILSMCNLYKKKPGNEQGR